ncbi:MAG: TPM domain-containing protein [Pirellulales bacterium]
MISDSILRRCLIVAQAFPLLEISKGAIGSLLPILLALLFVGPFVHGQNAPIDLQPPGDREFLRDLAEMIDPEDETKIQEVANQLLTDRATPIIVVTIDSMAEHGGGNTTIESFAMTLFNQWGIGHEKLGNQGILLLVSQMDRKARIELGKGWGRDQDALCQQIMNETIIPRFKQGHFSDGILQGVIALDKMARGEPLPQPPKSSLYWLSLLGMAGLILFTSISLVRRGSQGWAWLFWGTVLTILGAVLYHVLTESGGSSGSRGYSGGSFGGGSSGGGGATGSW